MILAEFGVSLRIDDDNVDQDLDAAAVIAIAEDSAAKSEQCDIRAQYIQYYLESQYSILRETIDALDELIQQAEEEEQDNDGEEEEEGVERGIDDEEEDLDEDEEEVN